MTASRLPSSWFACLYHCTEVVYQRSGVLSPPRKSLLLLQHSDPRAAFDFLDEDFSQGFPGRRPVLASTRKRVSAPNLRLYTTAYMYMLFGTSVNSSRAVANFLELVGMADKTRKDGNRKSVSAGTKECHNEHNSFRNGEISSLKLCISLRVSSSLSLQGPALLDHQSLLIWLDRFFN